MTAHTLAPAAAPYRPITTRFQGSKHKLLGWLWTHLQPLSFHTCLDAFAGSGCVSHFLKAQQKAVTSNDILVSGMLNARALVENQAGQLDDRTLDGLLTRCPGVKYDNVIARTFDGIYFTTEENEWLDLVCQNIQRRTEGYPQAIAYHALFQAAMAKRPYNLFHRKNLYMRLADVSRTFGNKATWDKPFETHFRAFALAANAAVFPAGRCVALHGDAVAVRGDFDLVYLDPPYINRSGVGVDYHGFYHFLEGLSDYANWPGKIDMRSRHRRLFAVHSPWKNPSLIGGAFRALFDRYRHSTIVVSYRSDGIPSPEELAAMLRQFKRRVTLHTREGSYKYALSTNAKSSEILLIGAD